MIHKTDYVNNCGIPLVNPSNIIDNEIEKSNLMQVSHKKCSELERYKLSEDDIILARRGNLSKCAVVRRDAAGWLCGTGSFFLHAHHLNPHYFSKIYTSSYIQDLLQESSQGSTMDNLNQAVLGKILLPIAPRGEQDNIVEKLDKIAHALKASEEYRCNLQKKETLLRKAILKAAIQGKLVPQLAEEGSALDLLNQIRAEKERLVREGKLKPSALVAPVIERRGNSYYENGRCIDDEIPFDIPDSWAWVRLENICSYIQRGKSPKYADISECVVVSQKCVQWTGFDISKARFIEQNSITSYAAERFLEAGDLLWNSTGTGTLGRINVYEPNLCSFGAAVVDSHVTLVRTVKNLVSPEYLCLYFSSPEVQDVIEERADGTTNQKELSTATIKRYLVPLPPTGEQRRIVEGIKRILPLLKP